MVRRRAAGRRRADIALPLGHWTLSFGGWSGTSRLALPADLPIDVSADGATEIAFRAP